MPATKTQAEPTCPKCSGAMWDNRLSKRNPKAPDWKCRDKACDGVIWPERKGPVQRVRQQPPMEEVGTLPGEYDDEPPPIEEAYAEAHGLNAGEAKCEAIFHLYDYCYMHAVKLARQHKDVTPDISAVAATLFIAASQRGITV